MTMLKPSERSAMRILQDKVIARLKMQGHNIDGEIIIRAGNDSATLGDLKTKIYPQYKYIFDGFLS